MFAATITLILIGTIHLGESAFTPVVDTLNFPWPFSLSNNTVCRRDVEIFIQSLENNTLWAYRLWEASPKLPLGLTEGSQYQLGNFDECLSIKEPFVTQYCLTTINIEVQVNKTIQDPFDLEYRPYINLYEKIDYTKDPNKIPRNKIFWGLCVPESCNPEDIKIELQKYLDEKHNLNIKKYKVELKFADCQTEQTGYSYTTADYLFCIVIGVFIIISVICTIYSFKYIKKNKNQNITLNKPLKLLLCFSIKENILELSKPDRSNKHFRIFYWIKFFFMFCILFGHSIVHMMIGPVLNFSVIEQINRTLFVMPMCSGVQVVDIFFLFSGLLNTYSYLVQTEKQSYRVVRSIILRYFRLAPVFVITTFFYSTLFYKMGSGPLWPKIIGAEKNYCERNWWINILFLNNYIGVDNLCACQGWYLATEFQLFLLSIPLNYLIKKNCKLSWTIISTIFCGTILIPFLVVYIGKKEPLLYVLNNFFHDIRQNDHFQSVYVPMHTRMSAYLLGMFAGFIYYKLKDTKLKLSLVPSLIIILPALILGLTCLYGGVVFYNPYTPYDALKAGLYAALDRPAFIIAFSVLVFGLSFGLIPPHLLTWSPMITLSKLSFSCYLVHLPLQLLKAGSHRVPQTYSIYYCICQAISELVLTLFMALFLFIFIENPCINFMKEILPKKQNCIKRKITKATLLVVQ